MTALSFIYYQIARGYKMSYTQQQIQTLRQATQLIAYTIISNHPDRTEGLDTVTLDDLLYDALLGLEYSLAED